MTDDNHRSHSCSGRDGTRCRFTISEYDRASIGVVEAVATATDRDAGSLPPLGRVIDPDALDDLLGRGGDVEITFEYADAEVTVQGDGTVFVTGD
ncbi:HalOD1 output domain-containing protein [Halobacterium jilantaiense]|uniref:Halobacterial output domain-containing protein n=1 Tax=Halobacterium jilantaiense TaxID=355548 RepID=A0A1I0PJ65_9EURY|nr:HalOD1 output domain-containing protein [Halobacterium jilantaiense]SEW14322.1 hypothetical protein SAMN04487945_1727 [Halobacterium jilantaiense]